MAELEQICFKAALIALALSIVFMLVAVIIKRTTKKADGFWAKGSMSTVMAIAGVALLTISLIARAIITGHGPFSSMYEFSLSFSWGILIAALVFHWRFKLQAIRNMAIVIALALLIFASTLPSRPIPLVPALQQSLLLSVHVACAIVSYGTFAVGFISALLYIWQNRKKSASKTQLELLDTICYRSILVGFPFLALTIILGAIWADIAWGHYWSWDPKETASLVTWLLYAGYLHARVMHGWQGTRAAILVIVGFAAVLFTFFGNYIFSGLHSYG